VVIRVIEQKVGRVAAGAIERSREMILAAGKGVHLNRATGGPAICNARVERHQLQDIPAVQGQVHDSLLIHYLDQIGGGGLHPGRAVASVNVPGGGCDAQLGVPLHIRVGLQRNVLLHEGREARGSDSYRVAARRQERENVVAGRVRGGSTRLVGLGTDGG